MQWLFKFGHYLLLTNNFYTLRAVFLQSTLVLLMCSNATIRGVASNQVNTAYHKGFDLRTTVSFFIGKLVSIILPFWESSHTVYKTYSYVTRSLSVPQTPLVFLCSCYQWQNKWGSRPGPVLSCKHQGSGKEGRELQAIINLDTGISSLTNLNHNTKLFACKIERGSLFVWHVGRLSVLLEYINLRLKSIIMTLYWFEGASPLLSLVDWEVF